MTLAAAALTVGLAPLIWHPRYFAHGAGWTASQVLAAAAGLLAAATALPAFGLLAPLNRQALAVLDRTRADVRPPASR